MNIKELIDKYNSNAKRQQSHETETLQNALECERLLLERMLDHYGLADQVLLYPHGNIVEYTLTDSKHEWPVAYYAHAVKLAHWPELPKPATDQDRLDGLFFVERVTGVEAITAVAEYPSEDYTEKSELLDYVEQTGLFKFYRFKKQIGQRNNGAPVYLLTYETDGIAEFMAQVEARYMKGYAAAGEYAKRRLTSKNIQHYLQPAKLSVADDLATWVTWQPGEAEQATEAARVMQELIQVTTEANAEATRRLEAYQAAWLAHLVDFETYINTARTVKSQLQKEYAKNREIHILTYGDLSGNRSTVTATEITPCDDTAASYKIKTVSGSQVTYTNVISIEHKIATPYKNACVYESVPVAPERNGVAEYYDLYIFVLPEDVVQAKKDIVTLLPVNRIPVEPDEPKAPEHSTVTDWPEALKRARVAAHAKANGKQES